MSNGIDRLRIAIQKSGRLSRSRARACCLVRPELARSRDRLFCYGEILPIDLLLVRDDDIPGLIADGGCDLGIVGRNVLAEQVSGREAAGAGRPRMPARWASARCRLAIAVPEDWDLARRPSSPACASRPSYPGLLAQWLGSAGHRRAEIVLLTGSVEIAPRLGQADPICDLVSSGATLAANQLKLATLLQSEAVLARPAQAVHRRARAARATCCCGASTACSRRQQAC